MDSDFFFRQLRERLNPHLLHYLVNSRHSIGIWGLQDRNGLLLRGNLLVLYDESDLLTVVWEQGSSQDPRACRQHHHICPDTLRHYWHWLGFNGHPNPSPRLLTFSHRPEPPFPCPHLFSLRNRLGLWREHSGHSCMLPGPSAPGPAPAPRPALTSGSALTIPTAHQSGPSTPRLPRTGGRIRGRIYDLGLNQSSIEAVPQLPPLMQRVPRLVLPPVLCNQLPVSAAAREAPNLLAILARGPLTAPDDQPLNLSAAPLPAGPQGNFRVYISFNMLY